MVEDTLSKSKKGKTYSERSYKKIKEISEDEFDESIRNKWKYLTFFLISYLVAGISLVLTSIFELDLWIQASIFLIQLTGIAGAIGMYFTIRKFKKIRFNKVVVENDERSQLLYFKSMTYAFYSVVFTILAFQMLNLLSKSTLSFKEIGQLDNYIVLWVLSVVSAITFIISYFRLYYK